MPAKSRNKGSGYERAIATLIRDWCGVRLVRDLEQYRQGERGDLVLHPDDAGSVVWPWLIECKRYASGPMGGKPEWWTQVCRAADVAGKLPALFYRYDRGATHCVMRFEDAVTAYYDGNVVRDVQRTVVNGTQTRFARVIFAEVDACAVLSGGIGLRTMPRTV